MKDGWCFESVSFGSRALSPFSLPFIAVEILSNKFDCGTAFFVKEYRYRLRSYGIQQLLPGIGVIYKIRNLTNFNQMEFN